MSLVRTHGATGARSLARDPYSLARELFGWEALTGGRPGPAFSPTFEVKETTDTFVLKADVPGVDEKDLDVAVHKGVLTVSGQRRAEARKDGETYSLYERAYGSFARSFALPDTADGERIEARLEQGVLTLTVAKRASASPRKISITK